MRADATACNATLAWVRSFTRCVPWGLAAIGLVTACELNQTVISPGESSLVLHAVLNQTTPIQSILLERAWDGVNYIYKSGQIYTQSDPVGTGAGYGEIQAEIDITTPSGAVVRATEPRLPVGGYGGGLYWASIPGTSLVPGGTYELRIRTKAGELMSTRTTVPLVSGTPPLTAVDFDRTRDTVPVEWATAPRTRAYLVVIQNPYRNVSFFTDSTVVRLTGGLRNVLVEGLPHVFLPGFQPLLTVFAVDSNYYDYYRADLESDRGDVRSRVEGGFGVFGAAVPVLRQRLKVSAPFVDPVEGVYSLLGSASDSAHTLMIGVTLYLESKAARSGNPDAITGRYRSRPGAPSDSGGALVGIRFRDSVRVAFLRGQRLEDTIEVYRARVAGDTLIGKYSGRLGTWSFLKVH